MNIILFLIFSSNSELLINNYIFSASAYGSYGLTRPPVIPSLITSLKLPTDETIIGLLKANAVIATPLWVASV